MDRYLEEISKTSADSDALELAASASTSMSPNRFTDKLYESMKWSLSVQPSSVASAGQVIPLLFDLFVLGSFSQRSSPSRHSPCILLKIPFYADRHSRHRLSAAAHRRCLIGCTDSLPAAVFRTADAREVGLEVLELRWNHHRQHGFR